MGSLRQYISIPEEMREDPGIIDILAEGEAIDAEREALMDTIQPQLQELTQRKSDARERLLQVVRSYNRSSAKERIKALGKRRRVWYRRDSGERLPYGVALTTVHFGPKRCSVTVAEGPGKGDEWRIPYTDLVVERPSDSNISLNRGMGRSINAVLRGGDWRE